MPVERISHGAARITNVGNINNFIMLDTPSLLSAESIEPGLVAAVGAYNAHGAAQVQIT
jgi:hypothetical protein